MLILRGFNKTILKIFCVTVFSSFIFLLSSTKVYADQTWDGGAGSDTNWNTCANWTNDTCPISTDIAIFNSTSTNNATINTAIDVKGISIATGYSGIITQSSSVALTLGSSGYSQVTGTFIGGDSNIDINGSVAITGGSFTSTSGNLSSNGNFSNTGSGSFSHNMGTITMTSTTSGKSIDTSAGMQFYNLTLNGVGGSWSMSDNPTSIKNNLTISNGTLVAPNDMLFLGGSYSNSGTFTSNSGSLILNSTTTGKSLSGNMTGTSSFENLFFDGIGGAWTFGSNATEVKGSFHIYNGSVTAPSSTLTISKFYSNTGSFSHNFGTVIMNATGTGNTLSGDMDENTSPFYNLTFNGSGGAWSFGTYTATIVHDFTITNGTVTAPSTNLAIGGNYLNSGTFHHNNGTVRMINAGVKTLGGNITLDSSFYDLEFSAPSGSLIFAFWSFTSSDVTVVNNFVVTKGDVTAPLGTMSVGGNFSLSDAFHNNAGTVLMTATTTGHTISGIGPSHWDRMGINFAGPRPFHNLTLDGVGGSWTLGDGTCIYCGAYIEKDLTITNGTLYAPSSTLEIGGNFINTGVFNHNSGSVILTGSDQSISGTIIFNNLTKTVDTASTLTYEAGAEITVLGLWTMRGAPGNLLSLHSSTSPTKWIINPSSSRNIAYLSIKDSNNVNSSPISVVGYYITDEGNNLNWSFGELPHVPLNLAPTSFVNGSWTNNNTPRFTFNVSLVDGADLKYKIEIDNNSDFSSPEISYTSDLSVDKSRSYISSILSDGMYYFRIKTLDYLDNSSAWTVANSGQIAFKIDTTKPSVPGTPVTATPTANSLPTWSWSVSTDSGIGLKNPAYIVEWCLNVSFSGCSSNTATTNTNSYMHSSGLTNGTWYFKVKSVDAIGNESDYSVPGVAAISPDAPTGTISINSNDQYTNTNSVTLSITGTDSINSNSELQMILSNNADFSGSSYQPFYSTFSWKLVNSNGVKTVYMKLKNTLGTESSVFSDSIIYDSIAPTGLSLIYPVNSTLILVRPEFKWHVAIDDTTYVSKYVIKLTYADSTSITLDNLESFQSDSPSVYDHAKYTIRKSGDYIFLRTKDSNQWNTNENRGRLKPGLINVNLDAYDALGNIESSQSSFSFKPVDPKITLNTIDTNTNLGIQSDSLPASFSTTNLNPVFQGVIGSGEYANISITASRSGTESRTCNVASSSNWECRLSNSLILGLWNITLTSTDNGGNVTTLPAITLNVVAEKVASNITAQETLDQTNIPVDLSKGYTIVLTILDDNNQPLVGANITIPGDTTVYVTDKDGKVTVKKLLEGSQKVYVEYQGKTAEQTVEVLGANEVITKSISVKLINTKTDTDMRAVGIVLTILVLVILIILGRKLYLKSKTPKVDPINNSIPSQTASA
ncbi:MAG: hypothetical protein WCO33_01390 [bacterium]